MIRIHDAETHAVLLELTSPADHRVFGRFRFSPDGRYLIAYYGIGRQPRAKLWDLNTSQVLLMTPVAQEWGTNGWATHRPYDFHPDGKTACICGMRRFWLVRLADGKVLQTKELEPWQLSVAFSRDGRFLAVGSGTSIKVFSTLPATSQSRGTWNGRERW